MKWRLADVARACTGTAHGDAAIESVSIDSRTLDPHALFVAVRGETHDGHDFVADARARGAGAVVAEFGRLGAGPGVEVPDTTVALRRLAESRRTELGCSVIAVTGSSGKTTTKDLGVGALGPGTHASPRSYNNEFGVPLTVLAIPAAATAAIVEVGSRGPGDIALLAAAMRPDVAIITNVGRAHLETFGSVGAVADAKWELVEALESGGTAVLPADDADLMARSAPRVVTFGEDPGADVRATDISLDETGRARFTVRSGRESAHVRMPLPGRHQPRNATAAIAAALAVGRPFADAAAGIELAVVSPWRMETTSVPVAGGEILVINDAYNANPDSMAAAFATLAAMPGRHLAVLGRMHELGEFEAEAHREVGALAASLGFEVVTVGDDPGIGRGAGGNAVAVADPAAAVALLNEMIRPGDTVLVKASRAAGLEAVALGLGGGAT